MNAGKKKVLFLVTDFYQAGTERFTYEVHNAINKHLFDVDILCSIPLGKSECFSDYYYEKHIELGSKIHIIHEINQLNSPTLKQKIQRRLVNKPYPDERFQIKSFFDKFDCIPIMGEYNFKEIYKYIKEENKYKLIIHLQNSKYQVKDNYEFFPKNVVFHFVSGFHNNQIAFELSEFPSYKHTYYNLNLKFENEFVKTNYKTSTKPKIGIFTRLTPAKPFDPFIYSFQLVNERLPDAEFHIFRSGELIKEGVDRYSILEDERNQSFS